MQFCLSYKNWPENNQHNALLKIELSMQSSDNITHKTPSP